jgi:hypothetical protein
MTNAEMWSICAQAAGMLDKAECDWHSLSAVEDRLWPLVQELDQATPFTGAGFLHLHVLRSSLLWVRHHAYDALESELESRLAVALRSAMSTLEWLEQVSGRVGA